ncbi:hypothetical protein LG3211_0081 [Lysobacter gummosus]|nr:hypothetical protein LG3211_0081 [Lysobacter gummosus]
MERTGDRPFRGRTPDKGVLKTGTDRMPSLSVQSRRRSLRLCDEPERCGRR